MKELDLDSITFWKPSEEATAEHFDSISGTYEGFVLFHFDDGFHPLLILNTGNDDLFAVPRWYQLEEICKQHIGKLIEGKTEVVIQYKGKVDIGGSKTMARIAVFFDNIQVTAKKLLSANSALGIEAGQS